MKWKHIIIQHDKKGKVKMGDLSFNEIGRGCVDLMTDNTKLKDTLNTAFGVYANHMASQDACDKAEWNELYQ